MKFPRPLRYAFTAAAASLTIAGAGYGGYVAADRGYDYVTNLPMPPLDQTGRDTGQTYSLRLTSMMATQQELDNTTDEEASGEQLTEDKRSFATDAILDRKLSERDLATIAARFNAVGLEDGVRFRSYNFDARTIARRNECLHITPAIAPPYGADRYAYAQRVESCMISMTQNSPATQAVAARMGGMAGGGMALAFMLGRASRRRPTKNSAGKNTNTAAAPDTAPDATGDTPAPATPQPPKHG